MLNMDAAASHPAAQDHLARLHAAGHRARCTTNSTSARRRSSTTAAGQGAGDFVEQVACELPLQAIADLLGVPQEDRDKLFDWSNQMTGDDDPEYADVDPKTSSAELIIVRDGDGRDARPRTPATTSSPSWSRPTSTARS